MTADNSSKTSKEKSLAATYLELHRFGQNGDYDRALKCANRIINYSPLEEKAIHCKIVCLIQQSKFNDAVQVIQRNSTNFPKSFIFEKSYCYYRINEVNKALECLDEAEELDFRGKELKAQILYRLEHFSESLEIYRDIVKNKDDDYCDERETNLVAVMSQLGSHNEAVKPRNNNYELCYNWACLLISQGKLIEAEKKLKQCEKTCRDVFEEDGASEDEIDLELALVRTQLAYVYQKQGRIKEAQQVYASTLKLKLDDIALIAVASNNVVAINKDQNVFDSKKKMKAATNEALVHKLPSKQRETIALNNAILMYYTNQYDLCNKLCLKIEKASPKLALGVRVINALCSVRSGNSGAAQEILNSYSPQNNEEKLYLILTKVHFLLMQGEQLKACQVLKNLGEDTYKPGIVGTLITLYLGLKMKDTALKVFEDTVEWYRKNKVNEGDLSNMWKQAADFHMRNGQPSVAANSLEELIRNNPGDKKALARLVLAYLQFDKKKAAVLMKDLPKFADKRSESELDALENANWLTLKKIAGKVESTPGTPKVELADIKKKRKNHKRKPKLPKNYDTLVSPDPERWLPKHERTGFRKKRDRRVKEVIKGSQGTTSTQSDQFDFSSKAVVEPEQTSPVSSIEPSPKPKGQMQQQKKVQQKKKNKRR